MLKYFSVILILCLLPSITQAQLNEPYIRKAVQPHFFIPDGALAGNEPEKLSLPQYRAGQSTAKRISKNTEMETIELQTSKNTETAIEKNEIEQSKIISQTQPEQTFNQNNVPSQETSVINTDTPDYQKMYQEYLKDLENIAQSGNTTNSNIDQDLKKMNTEKRIKIDQEFNNQRNIKKEIINTLK